MSESKVRTTPGVIVGGQPGTETEHGAYLAAALAAALVEYRSYVQQRTGKDRSAEAGTNWRTVARWECLRGRV